MMIDDIYYEITSDGWRNSIAVLTETAYQDTAVEAFYHWCDEYQHATITLLEVHLDNTRVLARRERSGAWAMQCLLSLAVAARSYELYHEYCHDAYLAGMASDEYDAECQEAVAMHHRLNEDAAVAQYKALHLQPILTVAGGEILDLSFEIPF